MPERVYIRCGKVQRMSASGRCLCQGILAAPGAGDSMGAYGGGYGDDSGFGRGEFFGGHGNATGYGGSGRYDKGYESTSGPGYGEFNGEYGYGGSEGQYGGAYASAQGGFDGEYGSTHVSSSRGGFDGGHEGTQGHLGRSRREQRDRGARGAADEREMTRRQRKIEHRRAPSNATTDGQPEGKQPAARPVERSTRATSGWENFSRPGERDRSRPVRTKALDQAAKNTTVQQGAGEETRGDRGGKVEDEDEDEVDEYFDAFETLPSK